VKPNSRREAAAEGSQGQAKRRPWIECLEEGRALKGRKEDH